MARRDGLVLLDGIGPYDATFEVRGKRCEIRFYDEGDTVSFDLLDVRHKPTQKRLELAFLASGARCNVRPGVYSFIYRLYRARESVTRETLAALETRSIHVELTDHKGAGEAFAVGKLRRGGLAIAIETGPALDANGDAAWFIHVAPDLGFFSRMTNDVRLLLTEIQAELRPMSMTLIDLDRSRASR